MVAVLIAQLGMLGFCLSICLCLAYHLELVLNRSLLLLQILPLLFTPANVTPPLPNLLTLIM